MNRAAAFSGPCLQGLGPGIQSGEIGEERGVDVDDAAGEVVEKGSAEKAHESGKANEFHPGLLQVVGDLELGLVRELRFESVAVDVGVRDVRPGGPFQNVGFRKVGEHEGDLGR